VKDHDGLLKDYRAVPLGILLLVLACPACQRTPTSDPSSSSTSATPSGVAARVNGKDIPRADVEKYYQARIFDLDQKPTGDAVNILKLELLNDLITGELMAQKAQQLNLQPTEAEIDAEVQILKGNIPEEQFRASLQQRGLTEADLRRDLTRNLLTQKVVENQIGSKSQIAEPEVQGFYEENKQTFLIQEPQYRVGLIAVAENPPPGAGNPASPGIAGSEKIRAAASRLQAGDDFGQVARQFSDDPQTAQAGGDLGYQPAAALDRLGAGPKAAVLRLPVGDVTPALTVPGGFLLLKLLGKREPGQLTLENPEVRHMVQQELQSRRDQLLRVAFTEQLHNEARIENFLAREVLAGSQPAN
jgi:peptidyl-prolyl cis-trans isomerase SurA